MVGARDPFEQARARSRPDSEWVGNLKEPNAACGAEEHPAGAWLPGLKGQT